MWTYIEEAKVLIEKGDLCSIVENVEEGSLRTGVHIEAGSHVYATVDIYRCDRYIVTPCVSSTMMIGASTIEIIPCTALGRDGTRGTRCRCCRARRRNARRNFRSRTCSRTAVRVSRSVQTRACAERELHSGGGVQIQEDRCRSDPPKGIQTKIDLTTR